MCCNEALNELLVRLYRSLLQYAAESWLWSAQGSDAPDAVVLASDQQSFVARLADLLDRRGAVVDLGAYPTEYTDLHYVAFDYLLRQIVKDQEGLLSVVDRTAASVVHDDEASQLVSDIRDAEAARTNRLRDYLKQRSAPVPVAK